MYSRVALISTWIFALVWCLFRSVLNWGTGPPLGK